MSQSAPVGEIIVVDNNCTDRTVEIAKRLGARIVKETTQSIAAARNAGISASRFDWIALLDHDDVWEKDKIKFQWDAAEKCPAARIIATDISLLEDGERKPLHIPPELIEQFDCRQIFNQTDSYFLTPIVDILNFLVLHTSSLLVHREVFETAGMYDNAFCPQEDYEFQLRVLARFPLAVVHRSLSLYRQHAANTSRDMNAVKDARVRLIKAAREQPEKYLPNSAEFLVKQMKNSFVAENRALIQERNKV